jgi:hypothetical protein
MMSFHHANSILLKKQQSCLFSKKAAQVRGFHSEGLALNIDIGSFQRILFNKGATRFYRITH